MSCINPNFEFSVENCKTLETLGPKIQNARKCNMKVDRGVLKEFIHSYEIFSPKFQVLIALSPKNERVIWIF
jgi:hypothetical protein